MSTINALVHHIDQLLTQHRALKQSNIKLQSQVTQLKQQLLQPPDSTALNADATSASDAAYIQTLEDELARLISLFDTATEAHHD